MRYKTMLHKILFAESSERVTTRCRLNSIENPQLGTGKQLQGSSMFIEDESASRFELFFSYGNEH